MQKNDAKTARLARIKALKEKYGNVTDGQGKEWMRGLGRHYAGSKDLEWVEKKTK